MNPTLDRWLDTAKVLVVTAGVVWAWAAATEGSATAVGAAVGGLLAAWVVSPWSRVGRHTPHAQARAAADGPDDVVVYWRPGCTVAVGLLSSLSRAERDAATWVNVVRDREAAAFVRTLRGGNMVTPTAIDGTGRHLVATVDQLRPLLAAAG